MKGEHRWCFQFLRVHRHLHLQCGLSLYRQVAQSLIKGELIDKEFSFEHAWSQRRVDLLNLKLFKQDSDFCDAFRDEDLGEKDPRDQLYRKELLD